MSRFSHLPQTVIQANAYTSAAFDTWTAAERRTVLAMAAAMQSGDPASTWYHVNVTEVISTASLDESTYYRIKQAALSLTSRKIFQKETLPDGRKRFRVSNIISDAEYIEGAAKVRIRPTEAAREYFLGLKNTFTIVPLREALSLPVFAHARLHELLLQFQSTGWRRIPVEDLRPMLGLCEFDEKGNIVSQKYSTTALLIAHVIRPAIRVIEKNTSLQNIKITREKEGKRIIALRFDFTVLKRLEIPLSKAVPEYPDRPPTVFSLESQINPIRTLEDLSEDRQTLLRERVMETAVPFLPGSIRENPERLEAAIRECMLNELQREQNAG